MLLVLYAVALVVALLSPTSTVQSSLVLDLVKVVDLVLPDTWVTFDRAEVVMNAAIIAPLTFLGALTFPRTRWQDWTAYGFLGAVVVELVQGLFLPARVASWSDIVANGLGSVVGAVVARILIGWASVRDRSLSPGPERSADDAQ
ncbi:hypothetical protein GCM10027596_22270 [Nocardioides korecus]